MKRLILDIYKILYNVTHANKLSLFIALVYVTILDLITIQGLGMLLQDWLRNLSIMRILFIFPYYLGSALVILLINFLIMPSMKDLRKERQKKPVALPIIIYSLICVMLFAYIHYANLIM